MLSRWMITAVDVDHRCFLVLALSHLALATFVIYSVQGKKWRRLLIVLSYTYMRWHIYQFLTIRTQKYIEALTAKTKPKKILVCLIYYPDEKNTPSWANGALGALGYNRNPGKIQLILRKIFEEATRYVLLNCLVAGTSFAMLTNLNFFYPNQVPFKFLVQKLFRSLSFIHWMALKVRTMLLELSLRRQVGARWPNTC